MGGRQCLRIESRASLDAVVKGHTKVRYRARGVIHFDPARGLIQKARSRCLSDFERTGPNRSGIRKFSTETTSDLDRVTADRLAPARARR